MMNDRHRTVFSVSLICLWKQKKKFGRTWVFCFFYCSLDLDVSDKRTSEICFLKIERKRLIMIQPIQCLIFWYHVLLYFQRIVQHHCSLSSIITVNNSNTVPLCININYKIADDYWLGQIEARYTGKLMKYEHYIFGKNYSHYEQKKYNRSYNYNLQGK